MLRSDLEEILITFYRPEDSKSGYSHLKDPSSLPEGGLHAEILVVKEEVRLKELLDNFFNRIKSANQSVMSIDDAWVLVAAVFSLSMDLFSIEKFPDKYKPILDLLKETPRGLALDEDRLTELSVQNPDLILVLDHLVDEKFLVKRREKYIARKKVLLKKNVSFL